jgi:hypothetical protein
MTAYLHKGENSTIQNVYSSAVVQSRFGAHTASYKRSSGTRMRVKMPGCGINLATPSKYKRVKESVKLCLYSLSVPLWQVVG